MPEAAIYVPHGRVPDRRGFAPAIVAEQLARRYAGFSPLVISAGEPGDGRFERIDQLACHRLRLSAAYVRLFQKITRFDPWPLHARLAKLLRQSRPDILHVHQLEFPVGDFRRRYGAPLPIVVHAHVTTQRPGAVAADAYLAVSDYVRRRLVEKGFPEEALHVVRNGVDINAFAPATAVRKAELRRLAGIPQDAPVLLFFGRKQEVKGFDSFLEVAARLLPLLPELRVFTIGPEPLDSKNEASYARRQALLRELGQGARFFDLPSLPHTQLADYLRLADVALLPSRAEPQGMAMLEAMAAGCATISTRVGGIPESIGDGVSGVLLDSPLDLDHAVQATLSLLTDGKRAKSLAAEARRVVTSHFDWAVSASETEAIYAQLLSAASHRAPRSKQVFP